MSVKMCLSLAGLVALLAAANGATPGPPNRVRLEPGLPPVPIAKRLSLGEPSFAPLLPYPGLSAVYFVTGRRNGHVFSAILTTTTTGQTLVPLPLASTGNDPFASVTIPLTSTPPAGAELLVRLEEGGTVLVYVWPAEASSPGSARLNQVLPPLELSDLAGHTAPITAFESPVIVINWWSTWCVPCVEEIPQLNALVREFAGDGRVTFLAVSPEESLAVRRAIERSPFTYSQRVSQGAATIFGASFPRHLILNPQRRVTFDTVGYATTTVDDLRGALQAALLQSGPQHR